MLMFIFNKIESLSQQITTYHLQIPKIIAKKLCLDIMVRILWGNHLSFVFGLRCTSLSAFLWCVLSKAEYWEGQESDSIFNMYVGDAKNIVRIADTFFFCFFFWPWLLRQFLAIVSNWRSPVLAGRRLYGWGCYGPNEQPLATVSQIWLRSTTLWQSLQAHSSGM